MWFKASRKYARPMNRNDKVPRPKPGWCPIYFIIDEIRQKTGRSRNEARAVTKPRQSIFCELSKASRQDDIETPNRSVC